MPPTSPTSPTPPAQRPVRSPTPSEGSSLSQSQTPSIEGPIQGDLPGQQLLRDFVSRRTKYWDNPPYGPCTNPTCPAHNNTPSSLVLLGDDDPRCATCRSATAKRHQAEMFYPCDICGSPEAFRDPAHRRDEYLCLNHHRENGYEPTERAMVFKTQARVGATHSMGRRPQCILSSSNSPCGGEVKQRSRHGLICNRHWDPVKYDANRGS